MCIKNSSLKSELHFLTQDWIVFIYLTMLDRNHMIINGITSINFYDIFQHSKRNFLSQSGHVIFSLLCKHQ